jgi:nicotinamide mononucleotide adenylyltransferase
MLKLAVETSNWINVSEWETQQEGWSRTAESLQFHKVNIINMFVKFAITFFDLYYFISFQKALNDVNSEYNWAKKIQGNLLDREFPLNINLKLLCGADLIESFAVPGLWKDEDVSLNSKSYLDSK